MPRTSHVTRVDLPRHSVPAMTVPGPGTTDERSRPADDDAPPQDLGQRPHGRHRVRDEVLRGARPDAVFLKHHGWGSPAVALHSYWPGSDMRRDRPPAVVAAGSRVVAMDRRKHRRSDVASGGHHLDTLADSLNPLLTGSTGRRERASRTALGLCEAVHHRSTRGNSGVARVPVVGAMTPFFAGAVGEALVEATITDEAATTILATPSEVQIAVRSRLHTGRHRHRHRHRHRARARAPPADVDAGPDLSRRRRRDRTHRPRDRC